MSRAACEIVPFPPLRRQAIDWLELNRRRHTMHALIEVDITETRHAIRAYRARTGAPLSLTAFLTSCLARAVAEDRAMQAYRLGRRRLVLFADVDVGIMVERVVAGTRIPMPYVIRAANTKSLGQLQQEIQTAQAAVPETVAVRSLPPWLQPLFVHGLSTWLLVPTVLRRLIWTSALRNPYRRKRLTGTVGMTAMSMFGHGTGWGIAPMSHTLTLLVGGLARKPGGGDTSPAEREHLCLTVTFDHDVVDGAPAARFIARLTHLIEGGAGLHEQDREPDSTAAARYSRQR
jgi:hypothetical protein